MKKITALLLAAVLVLTMAGCSKKAEETAAPAEASTAAATEAATAAVTEAPTEASTEAPTEAAVQVPQEPSIQLHPIASDYYECAQREDNTMIYEAKASYISLNEADAAAYPELATALQEDFGEFVYASMGEFIEKWKENTADQKLDLGGEVPYLQNPYIIRMDSNVASILVNTYEFLGGAHGSTLLKSFNYLTNERSWVQLSTIVKDNDKLQQVLAEKLVKEYPETQFFNLQNDIKKYVPEQPATGDNISYVWTMDYDSIQFYFQEEALASHADGAQMIDLKFAEYPDLFAYTYGAAPENYISYMESYASYTIGDNTLSFDPRMDENGFIAELAFTVNGKESSFQVFCNAAKAWYVNAGQSRFVYVFTQGEDDEDLFYVYRIAEDGAMTEESRIEARIASVYSQTDPIGTAYGYSSYASCQTHEIPADPAGLKIDVKENGNRVEKTVSIENDAVVIK